MNPTLRTEEIEEGSLRAPTGEQALVELDAEQRQYVAVLGERLVGEGRFADAARAFMILVAAEPANGYYNRAHGVCCEAIGLYAEARRSLDRAIAIDARDAYALACRASIRHRQGDLAGAAADLRASETALSPRDVQLRQRVSQMIQRLAA